jgi:hypothetical protein
MVKTSADITQNDQAEYHQIRKDLIFVVCMNLVFLVALLGLYFFNRATGRVDLFFSHLLKF